MRLRFVKAAHGPYAENLHHVLKEIEGHFMLGFGDGGDTPNKEMSIITAALPEAKICLSQYPETQKRLDRVGELIDGFGSAFGLELLASVYWIINREGATSFSQVVGKMREWGPQKDQFTGTQIHLAIEALQKNGWVNGVVDNELAPV